MKKPKESFELDNELDDLDLDATEDLGFDLDRDAHVEEGDDDDEDIIELTEEIMEELDDASFDSEDFDFDARLFDSETGQEVRTDARDLVSEQATIVDDVEDLGDELFEDFSAAKSPEEGGGPVSPPLEMTGGDASPGDAPREPGPEDHGGPSWEENHSRAEGLHMEERAEPDFSQSPEPGTEAVAESVHGEGEPTEEVPGEETSQELEDLLDDVVSQLEERLRESVERMIESRMPELVRSLLMEEIDKLKKEFR